MYLGTIIDPPGTVPTYGTYGTVLRYCINDSQFGSTYGTSASICTRSSRFGPGHPSPRPRPNGPRDDGHGAAIGPSQITNLK